MLDQVTTPKLQVDIPLQFRRLSSPMVIGLHSGGVMLSSRHQSDCTKPGSLFPDEEHSYEPRRQVRFTTLSRNALPYSEPVRPQQHRPRNSPPKRKKVPPPALHPQESLRHSISPTVQALRKKYRHNNPKKTDEQSVQNQQSGHTSRDVYEDDLAARELWGFPVKYSPKKRLAAQWHATIEQNQRELRIRQEIVTQQDTDIRSHQQVDRNEADYAQYLYLASLYGPLDALLYCCCQLGSHGRVYTLLVDTCARRIQRWVPQRIAALRLYWIGFLAREITATSITEGFESIVYSFQHERHASALFQRLKLLRASRALRAWSEYSARMTLLREKIRLALARHLESCFYQWRDNAQTRKSFKMQLKQFARRKTMHKTFKKWQIWHTQHKKLRCHLEKRWLKTKRECCEMWWRFVRCNRSARILQRSWRLLWWRKQRYVCTAIIQRVYRGWRARCGVIQLRAKMDVHSVLLRVANVVTWQLRSEMVTTQRKLLLEREIIHAQHIVHTEKQAAILVKSELSKVVRNNMHRKLDNHIQLLQDNDATVPMQLAKTSSYLRRVATQRVIEDERALARREATAKIRATCNQHRDVNESPCVVCRAHCDFHTQENMGNFGFSDCHTCLSECTASVTGTDDALAELEAWKITAQNELTKLERCEQEYTVILMALKPSIAALWKSMNRAQLPDKYST